MGLNENDSTSETVGRRLGRLPMKTTRKALLFSDFFKFVKLPKKQEYWVKKTPLPLRSFGNLRYGNCVVGGTNVAAPLMFGVSRAMYSGPGVVLRCASGIQITVTPNHPVLTPRGFVSAAALQRGDDVLNSTDAERVCRLLDEHFNDGPATIAEVFQSLQAIRMAGRVHSNAQETYLPRTDDFHGDGGQLVGQIDVVRTNRFLLDEDVATHLEQISENVLAVASVESPLFARQSALMLGQRSIPLSSASGGTERCAARFDNRVETSGGSSADFAHTALYSQPRELSRESSDINPVFGGQRGGRFTALIPLDHDGIDWQSDSLMRGRGIAAVLFRRHSTASDLRKLLDASQGHSGLDEVSPERTPLDPGLGRQLCQRFPGLIATDKIVEVRDVHLAEHVYDLSTGLGWYSANGILVHNCTRAKQAVAAMRMERLEQKRTIEITDDEVIRVYQEMSDRLYGGGDNGAYEDDALNEWRNPEKTFRDTDGHPYTIDAYLRINAANHDEMRAALALAGAKGIAICLNLPKAFSRVDPPAVWDAPKDAPLIGDLLPGSWGGHSLWSNGYNAHGIILDHTWELPNNVTTWEAVAAFCDEGHLVIDSVNNWRKKATERKVKSALGDVADAVNAVSSIRIEL